MARRSTAKLVSAFRKEINCWNLGHDEEILIRIFVACLSERMAGRDPAELTTGQRQSVDTNEERTT